MTKKLVQDCLDPCYDVTCARVLYVSRAHHYQIRVEKHNDSLKKSLQPMLVLLSPRCANPVLVKVQCMIPFMCRANKTSTRVISV